MRQLLSAGARATYLRAAGAARAAVAAALAALPLVQPDLVTAPAPFWAGLAALGVLGGLAFAAPWPRWLASRAGRAVAACLPVSDVALVTLLAASSGGADSPTLPLYAAVAVFAAGIFGRNGQAVVLLTEVGALTGLIVRDGYAVRWGTVTVTVALIAVTALGARRLSLALRNEQSGAARVARQSDHRGALLRKAAETSREMGSLDPERALRAVVSSTLLLGFDGACLARYNARRNVYDVIYAEGLPAAFTDTAHWTAAGIPGLLRGNRTVLLTDYPTTRGAHRALVDAGITTVVGTPAYTQGPYAAALIAVTRTGPVGDEDVRALELLAAQARLAIENAQRFDDNRRSVQRLRELDRMKNDFLATVSHELRTPLTILQTACFTLEARWDRLAEQQRRTLLEQIRDHSARLSQIIVALLDFSALELVERRRSEQFSLSVLLGRLGPRLRDLFPDGALTVQVAPELEVQADQGLITKVIDQLVTNAAQHTPTGTPVLLRAEALGDQVRVTVADQGPGIAVEDQRNLGERFFRLSDPEHRGTGGLGLGLALVTEILRLHDTTLELESQVGTGCRFWFALPRRTPAERSVPASIAVPSPPQAGSSTGHRF